MGETGLNVWMGLTGLYIIDDPADPATLPSGAYELPLVIADRQFDENNQIQYFYDPSGVVGDKVLIKPASAAEHLRNRTRRSNQAACPVTGSEFE